MSLRKVGDGDGVHQETGRYENIKITVGYSPSICLYYVKLSDVADDGESVLLTDRSDVGYMKFAQATDFTSALHAALDAKGMYFDGNEQELASVVSNLTLQLMERIRNLET